VGRPVAGIEHVCLAAGPFQLRPPAANEAADALVMLLDPDVAQWNPAPDVVDIDAARQWCLRGGDWSSGDHATWSVLDASGRLLGNVSLWHIDREHQTAGIGYRTAPWARGRGVATEAVRAATAWAFAALGMRRVELMHVIENQASCRVAQKCGYALEGTLRSRFRDSSGKRWDEHIHGALPGT
jgi:RimJ/RimL family protein N-acetyltransferase